MAPTGHKNQEGLSFGLKKGHIVITKELAPRPCQKRDQLESSFVRSLIREVAGFAPYEKRITELLKFGKDKRALKVAKRALKNY
ncbi:hypothetical protein MKW92_023001 [Papaver armeniacum]|nr:hypothetical protein MKW92_023001 [Papaver armeniacum]